VRTEKEPFGASFQVLVDRLVVGRLAAIREMVADGGDPDSPEEIIK
jgi:hypothetical protein